MILFNVDNVDKIKKELLDALAVYGFVNVNHSTLGGDQHVCILFVVSLDKPKQWAGGYIENSRYARFYLENNGTLETFTQSGGFPKIRKSRNKTIGQVVNRIKDKVQP